MELTDLPMFGLVRRRLDWLNQRQEVIAQNIANADTPKFTSRDLKSFDFREALRDTTHLTSPARQPVSLTITDPKHIEHQGSEGSGAYKVSKDRLPYETAPDGNQIVLEEQMVKMQETQATHNIMTQLYKKHLQLFKTVIRGGGGAA